MKLNISLFGNKCVKSESFQTQQVYDEKPPPHFFKQNHHRIQSKIKHTNFPISQITNILSWQSTHPQIPAVSLTLPPCNNSKHKLGTGNRTHLIQRNESNETKRDDGLAPRVACQTRTDAAKGFAGVERRPCF